MGVFHKLSALLLLLNANLNDNLNTMNQGRVSILRFPSRKVNCLIYIYFLSNSIKTLKCLPIYNIIQVRPALNALHLNGGATTLQVFQKYVCWHCPAICSLLHALARLMKCGCSCIRGSGDCSMRYK